MNTMRRIISIGGVAALTLLSLSSGAYAQSSTATPKLNADTFKLPPKYDLGTFDTGKTGQDGAGFSLPNKIDLGKSQLHFDTSRKDGIPKAGLDNSDTSPLKAGIPSRDNSAIPPSYFGFTLTTPTR